MTRSIRKGPFVHDSLKKKIEQLNARNEKAGKLKRVPFADREAMKKMVDPVMAAYAKEIGADKIYTAINEMK